MRGDDAEVAVAVACTQLTELEQRWSRFIDSSEVSAINASAGSAVRVSPATIMLVERALQGHALTAGAFDPTVLGDLERAGYDRSFDAITSASAAAAQSERGRGASQIRVDARRGTVELPTGVGFDPGGIGKGLAADLVVDALLAAGAQGACVNIGGDARVAGSPADNEPWMFSIDIPSGTPMDTVQIADGAIATSALAVRRWHCGEESRHHLIDPRTGRPIDTDVLSVSVIAAHAWQSEVLTKAVFVLGRDEGLALADTLGAAALVINGNGARACNDAWEAFATNGASESSRHMIGARGGSGVRGT